VSELLPADPVSHVCEHGSLRRSCRICELNLELCQAQLETEAALDTVKRLTLILTGIASCATCAVCQAAAQSAFDVSEKPCTCHPDDNPPRPCPRKYALTECRRAADTRG
jgi:hypothetical protein